MAGGVTGGRPGGWVPHVWPMLGSTALMAVSVLLSSVLGLLGVGASASIGIGFAGLLSFGYLAHTHYAQAREALDGDPLLRGAWLVTNAWWVVIVAVLGIATLFVGAFLLLSL